jgi:hypothetical protein
MKISTLIQRLIKFDKTERQAYVDIYERDEHDCVISKKRYPISNVFAYEDHAKICVEQSSGVSINVL